MFPFTCPCCGCLPTSWTKIQDWLHLVLVLGIITSGLCLLQLIWEIGFNSGNCDSPFCVKQLISGLVVLPSTVYFIQTIRCYDEQLLEKKQRHQEEVNNLIDNINEQVAEMNELCRKVTGNANDFAVGRFNDKREHFRRFLRSVKAHYKDLYVSEELLQELRQFVLNWFGVFAGVLMANSNQANPMLDGLEAELWRCTTAESICDAATKRLANSKLVFDLDMPEDSYVLNRRAYSRTTPSNRSFSPSPAPSASGSVSSSFAGSPEEASLSSRSESLADTERRCGMSWVRCGRGYPCGRQWSTTSSGMPLTLSFRCGFLRILSRDHGCLLSAFVVDILLLIFEAFSDRWVSFILVSVNEACVTSMLACFEQINEIAQLEQQIHMYEEKSTEVSRRREQARRNWERVQQLHDLWLYRTLPCLSIMGKIHNHLADYDMARREALSDGADPEDPRLGFLRLANHSFSILDEKLGALEDWTQNGPLEEEWKVSIGQQLKDCEGSVDMDDLLHRLPVLTKDLRLLDEAPR